MKLTSLRAISGAVTNHRFNLGISCTNLRVSFYPCFLLKLDHSAHLILHPHQRYEEAAQHILDALSLQDSDSVRDPGRNESSRGVTSTALWESLKTCSLHMQRLDLATLCDQRDLEGTCRPHPTALVFDLRAQVHVLAAFCLNFQMGA